MKIKLLKNLIGKALSPEAKAVVNSGTVLEVAGAIGKKLIERKLAEPHQEPPPSKEPDKTTDQSKQTDQPNK